MKKRVEYLINLKIYHGALDVSTIRDLHSFLYSLDGGNMAVQHHWHVLA